MRISDLESYLARVYKAGYGNRGRVSVLLLGAPGIGKSLTCYSLAQRIAKSLGKEFLDYNDDEAWRVLAEPDKYFVFVDFRLTECEPSDLLGIPKAKGIYTVKKERAKEIITDCEERLKRNAPKMWNSLSRGKRSTGL